MRSRNDVRLLSAGLVAVLLAACSLAAAQVAAQAPASQETIAPTSQPFPLVKGPYLQAMRPDGLIICLEPSQNSDGRIVVQDAAGKTAVEKSFSAAAGKITRVAIDGLKPSQSYQYAVYLANDAKPAFTSTFKTFPPPGHLPVEFAATGDSRTHPDIFHEVCEGIRKLNVPMVVHTGDFAAAGRNLALWNTEYFQPGRDMLACTALFPAVGNHELGGTGPDAYSILDQFFVLPDQRSWYSFDYGGVHFLVLDSCRRDKLMGEEFDWAQKDLGATKAPWKVAVFHHPWFCAGSHESDVDMRRLYGPLFAKAGIDLILVGHDHNYQKTKPIVQAFEPKSTKPYWQIVTGGGGAPLYTKPRPEVFTDQFVCVNHYMKITAEKDRLLAVAYNMDGSELDHLEIRKDKPVEGTITFEQIELEQDLRDWLLKHAFVLRPGESAATLGGSWSNTLPVPVTVAFTLGQDKRFDLKADAAKVRLAPRAAASQPGTTDVRLKLQLLAPRDNLREMPTALNVSYDAPQVGSGKLSNIRVPLVMIKALQPAPAAAIQVDGKLDEPAWSQAQPLSGFRDTKKQDVEPAAMATTIQAAADRQNLYLAATCKLPGGFVDNDSADITKADNIRIDLAGADGKTITLVATPAGKTQLQPQDASAKVVVIRGQAGWTLEVAVPLAQLGKADEIRFNVQRKTGATIYTLMPLFGENFDTDTAAVIPMKAPAAQPVEASK